MNVPLRNRAMRVVVLGLCIQGLGVLVVKFAEHPSALGLAGAIALMIGTVPYIRGLALFAKAKGQHPAWCLLGLFSLFGLTVLFALPDLD